MLRNIVVGIAFVCAGEIFFHAAFAQPDANAFGETDALSSNPEVHITYYDVSGRNEDQIRSSIDHSASRPSGTDGKPMDALTTTSYKWSWWDTGNGECDPSRAQVTLRADVLLPRFVENGQRDLIEHWNRYMANLRLHEAGHVLVAKKRYADVLAAARSRNCAGINDAINRIVSEIRQSNAEYDKQTKHGIRQGAVFP